MFYNVSLIICLLVTFTNSLDPDKARQNVGPDLGPNCLTLMVFLKEFFEKEDFEEKNQQTTEKTCKITQCKGTYEQQNSLQRHYHLNNLIRVH